MQKWFKELLSTLHPDSPIVCICFAILNIHIFLYHLKVEEIISLNYQVFKCVFLKNKEILLHNHSTIANIRTFKLIQYYYLIDSSFSHFTKGLNNSFASWLWFSVRDGEASEVEQESGSGALHSPGFRGRLEEQWLDPSNFTNDSSKAPEREGAWLKVTQHICQCATFPLPPALSPRLKPTLPSAAMKNPYSSFLLLLSHLETIRPHC